jgi:hypothetical protein
MRGRKKSPRPFPLWPGSALLVACAGSACSNVLGIDAWHDPLTGSSSTSGAGGAGGSHAASAGSGGVGGASAGGGLGTGGAAPGCAPCGEQSCAGELSACEQDDLCRLYAPCMGALATCCQDHRYPDADPVSQALLGCLTSHCYLPCVINPTCADCFKDGLETDIDCGGDDCAPCGPGKGCKDDADCELGTTCRPDAACATGKCCG